MFDSRCSTVSNMRAELSSGGWFQNGYFSSMCVYWCECVTACFYPSFPVCQSSYRHSWLPETRASVLLVLTFCLMPFLGASGMLTFTPRWSSNAWICSAVMTLIEERTGSSEPKCHSLSRCKHLLKGASFHECPHFTSHREVWVGESVRINRQWNNSHVWNRILVYAINSFVCFVNLVALTSAASLQKGALYKNTEFQAN